MPKSRNRKNHKQKINARNNKIKAARAQHEKMRREFIQQLLEAEKMKQMENNGTIEVNGPIVDGEVIDLTENSSDNPIVDGPSF